VADAEAPKTQAPRSMWSGTISFGLVSIPVELYPALRPTRRSLRMLDPDGVPLARRYYCSLDGAELERHEIVRGYELESGEHVVVTEEDLEELEPAKSRDIDLRRFVPANELDPLFFDRGYYLTPGGDSTKAYRLLAAILERTGRAGIATFVMRGREYLVAILAEEGILRAETLRFADEVRAPEDVGLPEPEAPGKTAVKRWREAISAAAVADLDPAELRDEETEALIELVKEKRRSRKNVVHTPEAEEPAQQAEVVDLMEVLRQSLRGQEPAGRPRRRPPRRATARGKQSARHRQG
jgi:DNA end-binding protein Ku